MIGNRYGKWLVLEVASNEHGKLYYKCRCDCGKEQNVFERNLYLGRSTQCRSCCGKLKNKNARQLPEIKSGDRVGSWTILFETHTLKDQRRAMHCKCDCGLEFNVAIYALRSGRSTKCEVCLRGKPNTKTRRWRGEDEEFVNWRSMIERCYNINNKSFNSYGGRGILVCDEWRTPKEGFAQFLRDMGPKPGPEYSIDRIDNYKGYCKENCRWATPKQQSSNTRGHHQKSDEK